MAEPRLSPTLMANLLAFEAAARLGSFTRAADEAGISQPAVSLRIRDLEAAIGMPLFVRSGRGVALTSAGLHLWHAVKVGFDRIQDAIAALGEMLPGRDAVTIAVSSAFGSFWLQPRMRHFLDRNPSVDLRILTTDRVLDLVAERIPLCVRHGDGKWPDLDSWLLAPEVITPVCSPGYLAARGPIGTMRELPRHRLIHLHERHYQHMTWPGWFRAFGIDLAVPESAMDFSDYVMVLRAALAGDGIALGWDHLVADLVAAGELALPFEERLATGDGYWVVAPRGRPLSAATVKLREWLVGQR